MVHLYLLSALLFFYILFKVGICQCIGRSLCRMCCAACEAYWFALEDITCFLWHKLKNTKRINRRRRCHFQDIEQAYSSSDENSFSDNYHHLNFNRRCNVSRRRKGFVITSSGHNSHGHHHHVRLKNREVGVYDKGRRCRRLRSSGQIQLSKMRSVAKEARISKRRRLR